MQSERDEKSSHMSWNTGCVESEKGKSKQPLQARSSESLSFGSHVLWDRCWLIPRVKCWHATGNTILHSDEKTQRGSSWSIMHSYSQRLQSSSGWQKKVFMHPEFNIWLSDKHAGADMKEENAKYSPWLWLNLHSLALVTQWGPSSQCRAERTNSWSAWEINYKINTSR